MCWPCSAHYLTAEFNDFFFFFSLVSAFGYIGEMWILIFVLPLPESGAPLVFSWWRIDLRCTLQSKGCSLLLCSISTKELLPGEHWIHMRITYPFWHKPHRHFGTSESPEKALNQAWCSVFPVETSSFSYCFQRGCFTQEWFSKEKNLCVCNFHFMS